MKPIGVGTAIPNWRETFDMHMCIKEKKNSHHYKISFWYKNISTKWSYKNIQTKEGNSFSPLFTQIVCCLILSIIYGKIL